MPKSSAWPPPPLRWWSSRSRHPARPGKSSSTKATAGSRSRSFSRRGSSSELEGRLNHGNGIGAGRRGRRRGQEDHPRTADRRPVTGEPAAVVLGPGQAAALSAVLAEYGAATIYAVAGAEFDQYLVAPKAEALAAVAAQATPAAVLVCSTLENKEIAARLAIKLGSGVLTDAVAVNPDGSVEQSIF